MFNGTSRRLRFLMVFVLALSLSAVYTSSAQSTSLPQIVKTQDGKISVHLPQGWGERDTSASVYPSVLAFGDSATSLQGAVDSVTTTQTTEILGSNGVIAIVAPTVYGSGDPDTAITTLFNALATGVQQQGGQVLQQQTTTIGNGGYDAIVGVSDIAKTQSKGLFGAFTDGTTVAVFALGASPEAAFDANQQMFTDILDSVRVPAEAGGTVAPLPLNNSNSNTTNNSAPPAGQGVVAVSKGGVFSVRLPQDYVSSTSATATNFSDTLAFGANQTSEESIVASITGVGTAGSFTGIAGFIGEIDPGVINGQALDSLVGPLIQGMLGNIQNGGKIQLTQPAQAHTFGGQYVGELAGLNVGYVGVLHNDQTLLVVLILSDNPSASHSDMLNIVESIRIPAESASNQQQPAEPTQTTPVTTNATSEAPAQTSISNDLFSMAVPAGWSISDNSASKGYLSYGDSSAAAASRLHAVKPDVAPAAPISGNGGVLVLYPMSQFNIDPKNPDLTALMQRVLSGLQGYTIEQAAQPLEGTNGGVIAVISGSEHGYLALIPLGDQIAYVTATSTSSGFAAMQATLLSIIQSVQPISSGLGGLGGLEATPEATQAATPEITPTVESAGLGGLGSLAPATPNATPEA